MWRRLFICLVLYFFVNEGYLELFYFTTASASAVSGIPVKFRIAYVHSQNGTPYMQAFNPILTQLEHIWTRKPTSREFHGWLRIFATFLQFRAVFKLLLHFCLFNVCFSFCEHFFILKNVYGLPKILSRTSRSTFKTITETNL